MLDAPSSRLASAGMIRCGPSIDEGQFAEIGCLLWPSAPAPSALPIDPAALEWDAKPSTPTQAVVMKALFCIALALAPLAATGQEIDHLKDNEILKAVQTAGVKSSDGVVAKLPEFTLTDGLDAAEQRAGMEKIADRNHPVDALLRKAVTAPFVLKISDAQPDATMRRIDLWFVVHGDLDKISDEKFLKQYAKEDKEGPVQMGFFLEPEELKTREIELKQRPGVDERYAHTQVSLFDRVYVLSTGHGMKSQTDESVVTASMLDDRFANDKEYPNQWSPLERTETGKLEVGDPHPYSGSGSYLKATKLKEPAGAIFLEYHIVFDEPKEWFNGANLLRSKLPILVQDEVRKFRRRVAEGKK
jgi:hypothetical protein